MRISFKRLFLIYFYSIFGRSKKEKERQNIIYCVKQGLLSYCKEKQFFINRLGIINISILNYKKNKPIIIEIESIRQNIMIGYNYNSLKQIAKHVSKYLKEDFSIRIIHATLWDDVKFENNTSSEIMECSKFVCDDCGKCVSAFREKF